MNIRELLEEAVLRDASDIHLTAGVAPVYRIHGRLTPCPGLPLTSEDMEKLFSEITENNRNERDQLYRQGDVDFSYAPSFGRYRVNAFRQRGTIALAIRVVKEKLPTMDELGFPEVIKTFTRKTSGLVLAVGPAGSGKSTTLAAMVDFINNERSCHIITLEDPIEYWHKPQKSIINQRQIKTDSQSFQKALRAALRQDPDVILVGEMRDAETIEVTITAAETGHLVLATLHTKSASAAVGRIIDAFPPHQRTQAQSQLANVLEGVVAQQLLPNASNTGRVAAMEVLVATPAVRNLIREGKIHQLDSVIQTGAQFGMQTMDAALRDLYCRGKIQG